MIRVWSLIQFIVRRFSELDSQIITKNARHYKDQRKKGDLRKKSLPFYLKLERSIFLANDSAMEGYGD